MYTRILCILNNSLERLAEMGLLNLYPEYFNPAKFFSGVFVVYRYRKSSHYKGKWPARRVGKKIINNFSFRGTRVQSIIDLPFLSFLLLIYYAVQVIKRERINVIRAYNPLVEGLAAIICQFLTGVPAIVSVHNDYDRVVNVEGYPFIIRLAMHFTQKIVYNSAREVWCVSSALRDYVIKFGASPSRVKINFNRIRTSHFKNACKFRDQMRKSYDLRDLFAVLFVGRFTAQKNIPTLLKAFKRLRARGYRAKLILIGDGPLRHPIMEMTRRYNLNGDVILPGIIPNKNIGKFYAMADVFVLPSYVEGFGVVLIEAQSAGLPIIASNIPQVKDIVTEENALLFNPYDVERLTDHLIVLIRDKSLRERLKQRSIKHSQKFEWELLDDIEAKLYQNVLK